MERDELLSLGIEEEVVDKILEDREKIIEEYDGRLKKAQKEHEIERLLTESGARNIRAVRALITSEDADGVREEIESLKKGEDTRFLFEKRGSYAPYRSPERLPDTKKSGFEERLNMARKAGNTIEAIRIKQEAAAAGIMLL